MYSFEKDLIILNHCVKHAAKYQKRVKITRGLDVCLKGIYSWNRKVLLKSITMGWMFSLGVKTVESHILFSS